jgi:ABC-2 type transport system ATP-binding protein
MASTGTAATATSDNAVEVHDLTKRYGDLVAVDSVDLVVPRACAFGYLGPNGAGKTTLIKMLLGLTRATAGEMTVLGERVPEHRETALARVGAIVEEPGFHKYLTGRENLRIVAAARAPEAHARIDAALARVGLADRADHRVKTYSQGMRQRLGVARCLLADPELLILDEPTNGLDPAGIQEFREFVRSLVDEGRTILLSSHLLGEVERICDAVAIVDRGRVVAQGSIAELTTRGNWTIRIECDAGGRARDLLVSHPGVSQVTAEGDVLDVVLASGQERNGTAAELNRMLVNAGIGVRRLEPRHASLEQMFLEITSRLEDAA